MRQPRQAARDFCLAAAGRPDHQNVFRYHFLTQPRGQLLAPPTITQCNRHRALRFQLADNMPIKLRDDLTRGEVDGFGHGASPALAASVSRMILPFV